MKKGDFDILASFLSETKNNSSKVNINLSNCYTVFKSFFNNIFFFIENDKC